MRAVILLGLMAIADAIRENSLKEVADFVAVVFIIAAIMDIVEFSNKPKHDKN